MTKVEVSIAQGRTDVTRRADAHHAIMIRRLLQLATLLGRSLNVPVRRARILKSIT